jgi:excisionase family DNA binding protein
MPNMENDVLTLNEAAMILRVHPRTLVRWSKAGMIRIIPVPKGYRVDRAEIERFKQQTDRMSTRILQEA